MRRIVCLCFFLAAWGAKKARAVKNAFAYLRCLYARHGLGYCLNFCLTRVRTWLAPSLAGRSGAIAAPDFFPLPDRPFVSVLIVNYNGRRHLEDLVRGLDGQTYRDFEIIFVDNASTDDSVAVMAALCPRARVVRCPENVGFAEGNNIGLDHARGELIALLNNDTQAAPDWLERMVACLRAHPRCAAVAAKILFWRPFCTLRLVTTLPCSLDAARTLAGLRHYAKLLPGTPAAPAVSQVVRLPEGEFPARLFCRVAGEAAEPFAVTVNGVPCRAEPLGEGTYAVTIPAEAAGAARAVINNAGTDIDAAGRCADRGLGQEDTGQFDREETVAAVCGCAALVRRVALGRLPLFCPDFFAYFEDTELSVRLARTGGEIWYCPRALVRHKHASTSREWSPLFRYYVERNSTLFALMRTRPWLRGGILRQRLRRLGQLERLAARDGQDADFLEFARRLPELRRSLPILARRIASGAIFHRQAGIAKVGIFNNYWTTLGGGEMHACLIASYLRGTCPVDLIAEYDFSIQELERRFCLDLSHCRKLVIDRITEDDTRPYALFINSSFHSSLPSGAKNSLYIVNFPHHNVSERFLSSYDLVLPNSAFTRRWTARYWSSAVPMTTLYPGVPGPADAAADGPPKERLILGVGRFFRDGHSKKQREMVEAFCALTRACPEAAGWKLVLAGGVNREHPDDVRYFESVRRAARPGAVTLCPDIARDELAALYRRAAIFWHFAGIDIDEEETPEKVEHFGITTVEAMRYGCVPVVARKGGQPEVVGPAFAAHLFGTTDEAQRITGGLLATYADDPEAFARLGEAARRQAATFDVARHRAAFFAILDRLSLTGRLPDGLVPGDGQDTACV